MIRVRHIGSDHPEDFEDGLTFAESGGVLLIYRDLAAKRPIIAYGAGVWLTAEVING